VVRLCGQFGDVFPEIDGEADKEHPGGGGMSTNISWKLGGNRRQHPYNQDLLWCPKCRQYRLKSEFYKSTKKYGGGFFSRCKKCCKEIASEYDRQNREKINERRKRKYKHHPKESKRKGTGSKKLLCVRCNTYKNKKDFNKRSDRGWYKSFCKQCEKKWKREYDEYYKNTPAYKANRARSMSRRLDQIRNIDDQYVRKRLRDEGLIITPMSIELKRIQLQAKRTLKQLKEWRKEHESDRDVISGEQCEDEAVDEVYRGGEEAGHGGNSGLSAGV
jgi:hypothetical protein